MGKKRGRGWLLGEAWSERCRKKNKRGSRLGKEREREIVCGGRERGRGFIWVLKGKFSV